jgi:hypothetical protein
MVAILDESLNCVFERAAQKTSHLLLHEALQAMNGDPPSSIPFLVRLLENPASPLALPGKIDLYRHDCLHLLLDRGFTLYDEAFVVGFSMGNDVRTNQIHLAIFKLFSFFFYPQIYRFNQIHLRVFDLGFAYGRAIKAKNLNQFDFSFYKDQSLEVLRDLLGIDFEVVQTLRQAETILAPHAIEV